MDAVYNVISYIFDVEKTCGCIGAVSTCVKDCIQEMYLVKKYFNKLDRQNLIHIVISAGEFDYMEPEQLWKLAFNLTSYFSDRNQAVFAIHFENCGGSGNTHIHIAINTVSFIDGYKISAGYDLKWKYRNYVKDAIREYRNLSGR